MLQKQDKLIMPLFKSCAAGFGHMIYLCEDGSVWGCGSNWFGELGNGKGGENQFERRPIKIARTILKGRRVKGVAAGENHTLIWCEDGTLWGCGSNEYGQLGNGKCGDDEYETSFIQIGGAALNRRKVKGAAAGYEHTIIWCEDGSLWGCGSNGSGQLGDGDFNSYESTVSSLIRIGATVLSCRKIIGVVAGQYNTIIWCENSKGQSIVWGCGSKGKGQLGIGRNCREDSLTKMDTTVLKGRKVIGVALGRHHTLIWCEDGTLWGCGDNKFRQLGGNLTQSAEAKINSVPVRIGAYILQDGKRVYGKNKVVGVAAGGCHTIICYEDGSVKHYGGSNRGENKINNLSFHPDYPKAGTVTSKIIGVVASYYYTLVWCEDGTVWACGDNSSGQFGYGESHPNEEKKGNVTRVKKEAYIKGIRFFNRPPRSLSKQAIADRQEQLGYMREHYCPNGKNNTAMVRKTPKLFLLK